MPLAEPETLTLAKLPPLHRDPFDRMLVAQAIVRGLELVTPDPAIRAYPCRCLWLLCCGLLLMVCGSCARQPASSADGSTADDGGAPEDAASPLRCDLYPVPATDGAGDEAVAAGVLHTLDPSGQLVWNGERGTLDSIAANLPLPGCVGAESTQDHLLSFIGDHPSLFNIDVSEWSRSDELLPCDYVTNLNRYLSFGRVRFGRHLTQWSGALTVGIHDGGSGVAIFRVTGDFTPATTAALASALDGCENQLAPVSAVLSRAREMQFDYLFNPTNIPCNLMSNGSYQPNAADTIAFREDPVFHNGLWIRRSSAPVLSYVRKAWLIVDPSNYTDPLRASNASCGDSIGFELTIDAVTGEIISYQPGLGCVVC